jgi:type IV pilus assembly protein PilZ
VDLVVRVTYRTVDELFSEFARNINEGGIFIETENPQDLGSTVPIQFKLPGNDVPIEVVGTVIRITDGSQPGGPPGMGIEFGDLGEEVRQQINELVRQLRTNALAS